MFLQCRWTHLGIDYQTISGGEKDTLEERDGKLDASGQIFRALPL